LAKEIAAVDRYFLERGCHPGDSKFEDYGWTIGDTGWKLVLHDLGHMTNDLDSQPEEIFNIYFKPGEPFGRESRLLSRGNQLYSRLACFNSLNPRIGDIYREATGLQFDNDVNATTFRYDDIGLFIDEIDRTIEALQTIKVLRETMPPEYYEDRVQFLIDVCIDAVQGHNVTPFKRMIVGNILQNVVISNKYAPQFISIAESELKLYNFGSKPAEPSIPFLKE